MEAAQDWHAVYDYWFPTGLDDAGLETHGHMFSRWFGGGANADLPRFAPVVKAAQAGRLSHWLAAPLGRLSLIIVLDQFTRGLFAGTTDAYASDPCALRIAEEGLRNGHYDAVTKAWEKTFFFLPLGHAEGPDHLARLDRVVAMAESIALDAPERLRPLYQHSVNQARGHRNVISRFGRYPHRNPVLGRASSAEEVAYLAKGEFVHERRPSVGTSSDVRS